MGQKHQIGHRPTEAPARPGRASDARHASTPRAEVVLRRYWDSHLYRSREELAAALRYDPGRVAGLRLVQRSDPNQETGQTDVALVLLSVRRDLDLDACGETLGWEGCQRLDPAALEADTGYRLGALSPICPPLPLVMDAGLLENPTILVPSGHPGLDLELCPHRVADLGQARIAPLVLP